MAEQLHKGWLNTRDNEKFAPATLATQIYNENGTSFYTTVSNYIQAQEALAEAVEQLASVDVVDLKADLQAETEARAAKDQELEGRLQYFNGSADNALYIIDKSANVIAYVDGSGVNSTDFTIPTSGIRLSNVAAHVNDLQDSVESILTKLAYFDGAADNAFYIVDNNKNVIAYIDENGVHSTNFFTTETDFNSLVARVNAIETTDLSAINEAIKQLQATDSALSDSIEGLTNRLSYFNGDADDTFYIIDKSKNVIAYVRDGGIYSVDFHPKNGRSVKTLDTALSTHQAEFNTYKSQQASLDAQQNNNINALSDSVETLTNRLSYFNGDSDDAFYIIDKNKNVIAYIKEGGVYSVDFIPNEGRTHKDLDDAFDAHVEQYAEDKETQAGIDSRQDDSISALSDSVEKLSAYFNADADDTFYIIDKDKNVIAYIREGGVYSTNFTLKDGRNLVTLYDDYERILANAETYNTFDTIETWIEGAIETLRAHGESIGALGDSIEAIVTAVGLPSDNADYPGYDDTPDNLYEAVVENRTNINILNGTVTQQGSVAKAIDDLHKEILGGASADYQTLKKIETAIENAKDRLDVAEGEIDAIQGLIGESTDNTDATLLGKININAQNIASNDEDIEVLQTNTQYFNGAADDTLYIVDQTDEHNVIALVNKDGVKSIDFTSETAGSFNAAAAKLDNLQQFVEDFNAEVGIPDTPEYDDGIETLYDQVIENKDDIAIINGDQDTPGSISKAVNDLHTTIAGGASADYQTLGKIETAIEAAKDRLDIAEGEIDDIQELIGESSDSTDATLLGKININVQNIASNDEDISELQQNTQYFNGAADDALYIVDQSEDQNVIAVINGQGVKSIDFTTPEAGLNATAASLAALTDVVEDLGGKVGIPEEPDYEDPDGSLYDQVMQNKDDIAILNGDATTPGSVKKAISDLVGDATTYKTLGRIEDEIGLNYTAGENTVKGKIQTNANNIVTLTDEVIGDYPTSKHEPTGTPFPSLKTVYALIEANWQEIQTLIADEGIPGSVAYKIAQVVAGADASYDTLKEIADWILTHPEGASAMWAQINKNKTDIEAIFGEIGEKTTDAGQTIHQRIDDNDADIDKLEEKVQYFDGNGDDTLYIVDNTADHNIIAYINETGIHAINFTSHQSTLDPETNTALELENFNNLVVRVGQAEENIEALFDTDESIIGKLGIKNPPEYKNPKTNADLDTQTLYAQAMANQAAIYDIYKENGELDSLENRLLYTDPDNKPNTLNYTSIESIGETLGLSSETTAGSTVFAKIETLRDSIEDNEDALAIFKGEIGIPSDGEDGPDYEDPDPHSTETITTLYGQVMANQAQLAKLVKDEGILEQLEERLLGVSVDVSDDATDKADLTYQTIAALNDIVGPASDTNVEGDTVFKKIETLNGEIETLQDWSEGDQSWRNNITTWSGYNDTTYQTNYPTTPEDLADAVRQNREDINKLNNTVATDITGKVVSASIDERIAAHNATVMGDVENLNTFGKVEDAITTNQDDIEAIFDTIGEKSGEELADPGSDTLWSNIEDINRVFNNDSDDTVYVVDNNKNVVAYFDQSGLTTTNVIMSNTTLDHSIRGLGYNETEAQKSENIITFDFDI